MTSSHPDSAVTPTQTDGQTRGICVEGFARSSGARSPSYLIASMEALAPITTTGTN